MRSLGVIAMDRLSHHVRCARCATALDPDAEVIACSRCGQKYPRLGRIPVLLPRPDDHLDVWRQQLGLLIVQSRQTTEGLEAEAQSRYGLVRRLSETDVELRERCRATLRAGRRGTLNDYTDLILGVLEREAPVGVQPREILRMVADHVAMTSPRRR